MLRRLAFIRAARNVGLSLGEVAARVWASYTRRPDPPPRADWTRFVQRLARARLDDQIAGLLAAARQHLDSCIGPAAACSMKAVRHLQSGRRCGGRRTGGPCTYPDPVRR